MDWSAQGINLYKKKKLVATLGGQVLDGAIVLALIYDYHHGLDFFQQYQGEVRNCLLLLDKSHLAKVEELVLKKQWQKLNYR